MLSNRHQDKPNYQNPQCTILTVHVCWRGGIITGLSLTRVSKTRQHAYLTEKSRKTRSKPKFFWRLDAQPWDTLLKAKHLSTGTQCCHNIYSAIPHFIFPYDISGNHFEQKCSNMREEKSANYLHGPQNMGKCVITE